MKRKRNAAEIALRVAVIVWAAIIITVLVTAMSIYQEPVEPPQMRTTVVKAECLRITTPPRPVEAPAKKAPYNVPLDTELQIYIVGLCEEVSIEPTIVLAMIERESKFQTDAVGDGGDSLGLMQIQPRWHQERMDKLGADDLMNPYQNVAVGIDYLAEMLERYDGDIEKALMAYNAGCSGANKHWFSKGIYSNKYSRGVLEYSEKLKGGTTIEVLQR